MTWALKIHRMWNWTKKKLRKLVPFLIQHKIDVCVEKIYEKANRQIGVRGWASYMGLPKKKLKLVPLLGIFTEAIVIWKLFTYLKMKPRKPFYRKKKITMCHTDKGCEFLYYSNFCKSIQVFFFFTFFLYLFCVFINTRYSSIYGFSRHAY